MTADRIAQIRKILANDDAWLDEESAGSPHHGSMDSKERMALEQELKLLLEPTKPLTTSGHVAAHLPSFMMPKHGEPILFKLKDNSLGKGDVLTGETEQTAMNKDGYWWCPSPCGAGDIYDTHKTGQVAWWIYLADVLPLISRPT